SERFRRCVRDKTLERVPIVYRYHVWFTQKRSCVNAHSQHSASQHRGHRQHIETMRCQTKHESRYFGHPELQGAAQALGAASKSDCSRLPHRTFATNLISISCVGSAKRGVTRMVLATAGRCDAYASFRTVP